MHGITNSRTHASLPTKSICTAQWCLPFIVGAAAILQSHTASADVVYSGILNHPIPVSAQGTVVNFVTGVVQNGATRDMPGWDVNPYGTSATNVALLAAGGTGIMRTPGAGTNTFRTNLALGTAVGPSAFFYDHSAAVIGTAVGQWTPNSEGYFGLKFIYEAGSSIAYHYGFMALRIGANATDRTIVGFAYETTAGTAITVTPIPAPAAGLIALAAGFGARRRRR